MSKNKDDSIIEVQDEMDIMEESRDNKPEINEILEKMKALIMLCDNHESEKKDLIKNLKTCKIFLNMVIHDMRNPTNAIQMGI
jgi:light-regulated signal transduction histidine kinase (bacteriophytochrome)